MGMGEEGVGNVPAKRTIAPALGLFTWEITVGMERGEWVSSTWMLGSVRMCGGGEVSESVMPGFIDRI